MQDCCRPADKRRGSRLRAGRLPPRNPPCSLPSSCCTDPPAETARRPRVGASRRSSRAVPAALGGVPGAGRLQPRRRRGSALGDRRLTRSRQSAGPPDFAAVIEHERVHLRGHHPWSRQALVAAAGLLTCVATAIGWGAVPALAADRTGVTRRSVTIVGDGGLTGASFRPGVPSASTATSPAPVPAAVTVS